MYQFIVYIKNGYSLGTTIINLEQDKKLSDLSTEICQSTLSYIVDELNDDTHLYGFTENMKSFYSSSKYIRYLPYNDRDLGSNEKSCYKTNLQTVFNEVGKKMLFAFDFGTTTYFIIRRLK